MSIPLSGPSTFPELTTGEIANDSWVAESIILVRKSGNYEIFLQNVQWYTEPEVLRNQEHGLSLDTVLTSHYHVLSHEIWTI